MNRRHYLLGLLAGIFSLGCTVPLWGGSYTKVDAASEIFDVKTVLRLRIEISRDDLGSLRKDARRDVRAIVYEGSNIWRNVGVHIKGGPGSYRSIDDKPSLTLNFEKFGRSKRFHGLRKIHLNNSVQDQSYLCEYICSELFRTTGVPAARVSFASVALDGVDKGLYVLKEGMTKDMLSLYFKNTKGNLYEGGFVRDVDEPLENDGGSDDVTDWSDLQALAKAAQILDERTRWKELNSVLDVDRFISFTALEVITWNWDGYTKNRNNYRVYHDPIADKMVFLPHGMDQVFRYARGPILPDHWFQSIVAEGLISTTSEGEKMYLQRFGEIYTNTFRIEMLTNRVDELAMVLRPYAGPEHDLYVEQMRNLIGARHRFLGNRLRER